MTDLERIELACRRIADRERAKIKDNKLVGPDAVDLAMIKVFDTLAAELVYPQSAKSEIRYCVHNKSFDEPCEACRTRCLV